MLKKLNRFVTLEKMTMKKIILIITGCLLSTGIFAQSGIATRPTQTLFAEFTIGDTLFFGSSGSVYYLTLSGDSIFVNPWLKTPGLTVTGDINNYGTLTGDTASFNVLSASTFNIGQIALDSIYLSYGGWQKYYDSDGATQNVFSLGADNKIKLGTGLSISAFDYEPDTYGTFLDVDLTADGSHGDLVGAMAYVGPTKMIDIRAENDGTGVAVSGSEWVGLKAVWVDDENMLTETITGDSQLEDLPKGYMIEYVLIEETNGGTVTIKLGTTAGGTDIIASQAVSASGFTSVDVVFVNSLTSATNLFIQDTGGGWGTASINVRVIMKKIKN